MANKRSFSKAPLSRMAGEITSSALLALTRLLARQAARESVTSPVLESEAPADDDG